MIAPRRRIKLSFGQDAQRYRNVIVVFHATHSIAITPHSRPTAHAVSPVMPAHAGIQHAEASAIETPPL
jgi:hypothetical protein